MNKKLIIELKSDLCAGSGESLGSLIDTDICYDEYGLAYIPSKRLKGLLKEAFIEYSDWTRNSENATKLEAIQKELFGEEGSNHSCDLMIDNAYLPNIEKVQNDIENVEKRYQKYLSKQRVINTNTYIRYQTAVDDKTGVAKDNSLRSTRVLESGTIFEAEIECKTAEELEMIQKCLPLVTHMGANRTRGYGEIVCRLADNTSHKESVAYHFENEKEYKINLILRADSNIMVSKQNSESSEDFIPGSNIMGAIASKYIEENNVDFQNLSEEYKNLFLDGRVRYSNAYITEPNGEQEYFPAPLSYTKVKNETNQYHNKMYDVKSENIQLSNLDNKYVSFDKNNYLKDVKISEHYHHQRAKDLSIGHVSVSENGGTFFQFSAINMGQYFLAHITANGENASKIIKYLTIGDSLRVGKSKTAEYGKLTIKNITISENVTNTLNVTKFAVVLISPVILFDEENVKIANSKDVLIATLKKLFHNEELNAVKSFVGYSEESGYNAIWNLPKEQVSSYEKGTTIVFEAPNAMNVNTDYTIGLRTNEGYGNLKICELDANGTSELVLKKYHHEQKEVTYSELQEETKTILEKSIKNALLEEMQEDALKLSESVKLNNTTIGRVLLMQKESETVEEFKNNVNAIKDDKKLQKVMSIIQNNKNLKELVAYQDYEAMKEIPKQEVDKYTLEYVKQLFTVLKIGGEKKND